MAKSTLNLASRTAVVIGGTSGIGLALATGLAEAGADVIPTGRRPDLVERAATEIRDLGRRSLAATCDVTDRASLEQFRDRVAKEFDAVDILVNCAGITMKMPTLEIRERDWNRVVETNLNGTLHTCQIFGRLMIERGYGRIINIASLASFAGFYEVAAYGASKSAVVSLTKTLAVEWAKHGVCVNAIAPGVFCTDLNRALLDGTARGEEALMRTPMGRFGQVEELVGAAVFLASEAASFVTGHVLTVDGGFLASGMNQ
jgi:NAD(P)-dependent dehydrogenase (short-subunit alcohol dehydrogenase family)